MELIIIAGYLAVGLLMKFTDDILDNSVPGNSLSILTLITGVSYGAGMGILMSLDFYSVYIFGAIIIACLLTKKIDNRVHILALFTSLFIVFTSDTAMAYLQDINWSIFLFITVSAILDETRDIFKVNPLRKFFEERFGMRVALLALALTNLIGWLAFIQLIAFDIAYVIAGRISPQLLNSIHQK